ncbi:MAG: IS5 family transposase [Candidatus Izemoplasmatales bacterium]|nr:IS5 family transposase [Candidatus Izemoplasmatales bacterium]
MQTKTENRLPLSMFPKHLINTKSKWYTLATLVPWSEYEELLGDLFADSGRNAIPVRWILGSFLIQAIKKTSDRETLEDIMETPMFQYFLGLDEYVMKPLFDFSLLCKYRQRIGLDVVKEMIEILLRQHNIIGRTPKDGVAHEGSLSIDATVMPVNITYPTDLKLLNQVREKTEELIDVGQAQAKEDPKPRTYREEARTEYLKYAKAKRLTMNKRRSALRIQLQYIKRNIERIDSRVQSGVYAFSKDQMIEFSTCKEIFRQQTHLWETKTTRIDDRIVSLHQPHIRCIVRGKAGAPYEFGPKVALSKVNGFIHIDEISFDNFNEGQTLPSIVNRYKELHGVYPISVRADKIYQTRENKKFCAGLGIRLSGKPLGRPKNEPDPTSEEFRKEDFLKRLEIEGVIGVLKTKYGLDTIMTKLPESQKASIGLVFLATNLQQVLSFTPFSTSLEMLVLPLEHNQIDHVFESERWVFNF